MTAAQNMLAASMQACSQRIDKLRLSVEKLRLERLNLVVDESRYVIGTFESITHYLRSKGLS